MRLAPIIVILNNILIFYDRVISVFDFVVKKLRREKSQNTDTPNECVIICNCVAGSSLRDVFPFVRCTVIITHKKEHLYDDFPPVHD